MKGAGVKVLKTARVEKDEPGGHAVTVVSNQTAPLQLGYFVGFVVIYRMCCLSN